MKASSKRIDGWEEIEREIGRLALSDFAFIHRLTFLLVEGNQDYGLEIVLAKELASADFRLCFCFSGVRALRIANFGDRPTQLLGFEITDISDRGMEGLNWECSDYEQNSISFYARTARITLEK